MRDARRLPSIRATIAALLLGSGFFVWISGTRLLVPSETAWLMKLDWQYHFLGWHFFRSEPWHWPPGIIERYNAPIGTAIGFTDSIPLVALVLKPFSSMLPMPMQYLGLWLLACFALQALFGVLLTALWTSNVLLQIGGAALFVLVPTLLGRVGHPALSAHWLLLWALWMYFREAVKPTGWRLHMAFGVIAGLIHPYLVVMSMALLAALAVRRWLENDAPLARRVVVAGARFSAALAGVLIGWWAAGLFSVSNAEDLISTGLNKYSMNLLGPIAPAGWSSMQPEVPFADPDQRFEGFQYLGMGILSLVPVALAIAIWRRRVSWRASVPIVLAVLLCAIYSLSPRITLASRIVLDVYEPEMEQFAAFRVAGRFFWPTAYALVAGIVAAVMRLRPLAAAPLLAAAISLQFIDLRAHYIELRNTAQSAAFHSWQNPLSSPAWHVLLPHYHKLLLYGPEQCGPAPVPLVPAAFVAGLHGLSINTGHMARFDQLAVRGYCAQFERDYDTGVVDDGTVYLVHRALVDGFRRNAQRPVVCTDLDGVATCISAASYDNWKQGAADFPTFQ